MTMTPREQKIAIGVGVTIVVVVIYQFVITPYLAALDTIRTKTTEAFQMRADNALLFEKKHRLEKVWNEMTTGGLKADASEAESQAFHSVLDWANQAGVNLTSLKPERTTDAKPFQVIAFEVTANGSTPAISKLLLSFETSPVPVRVDEMHITPRKEGTDDLTVQLSVSTLCLQPEEDKGDTSDSGNAMTSADRSAEDRS